MGVFSPHTYCAMTPTTTVTLPSNAFSPRTNSRRFGYRTEVRTDDHHEPTQEVLTAVQRYEPRWETPGWEDVKPFAQEVVASATTDAKAAARLMVIAAPFLVWAIKEQGLPMAKGALFTQRVVEAYCSSIDVTDGTRATYRSALIAAAEAVNPKGFPRRLERIARRTIKPPYSAEQMVAARAWATGQHTALKRRQAKLMVALCAGAGLRANELELLCSDVTVDAHGVLLSLRGGETPRQVPVLREFEQWVIDALDELPADAPLWLSEGRSPNKSMLNSFTAKTTGAAPNGQQLRATWIVAHLNMGTPIKELMQAAGMTQFNNLHHYLEYVTDVDEPTYRNLLRGDDTQ